MPRVSVVVPIYNVESYLTPCLDSVAGQTLDDLEVVMVDDGSTDGSGAIAAAYAERDPRFRLVTRPNGGLSAARNTGIDAATGEFLAFLDSDDVLPPDAYARLLGALETSGSDFASGNVLRLQNGQTSPARFLTRAFAETRLKTHVTRYRPLLADRIAWNKLWRRSFWDEHGFRFPDGVYHEDIPITVPAHFMAASVDVLAEPVYLWRMRDGGELSITQRRLEQRVLLDRMAAIDHVRRFLADRGPRRARRWYDESVVADDLKLHVNVLDNADDDYRALFLEQVLPFLESAGESIEDRLPALDRLKWHLIRRRLMPELIEVLSFEKGDGLATTPPVRIRGRWYGDYPFRDDPRLGIPRSLYRLHGEPALTAHLEELQREGDSLRLRGFAYIEGIGAATEGSQHVQLVALRPGRLRRVRLRTIAARLRTRSTHRPDATVKSRQALADVSWSGFEATLDPRALRARGRWVDGTWDLYVSVRAGGVKRRRVRFALEGPRSFAAVDLPAGDEAAVRAAVTDTNGIAVSVRREWLAVRGCRLVEDGVLELTGEARMPPAQKPKLQVRRDGDSRPLAYPLAVEDGRFTARVLLRDLGAAGPPAAAGLGEEPDDRTTWRLGAAGGGRRLPVRMEAGGPRVTWRDGAGEIALVRGDQGDAVLVQRAPRAVLDEARWTGDGALELAGEVPGGEWRELVVSHSERGRRHAFPLAVDGRRFRARLTPARTESLAGTLPLRSGTWQLFLRGEEEAFLVPTPELLPGLPLATVLDRKPFALGVKDDRAVLVVQRDLDDDERGPYHQRRLREAAPTREPLRDAVLYASYGGREYSDGPRAIHEELVRRGAALEHQWVVRDGRCRVPEGATVLREGGREYYEALARARFVVTNDHFPDWFVRRPDQVCVQTWHGTPVERLGLDLESDKALRRFERRWGDQARNWQHVVSPNRFATPILRRAFGIEGEVLETGYPRVDALAAADRDARAAGVRARLGVPDGALAVLYAPMYRDAAVDREGRYRLDLRLDPERVRAAVGPGAVLLFRNHPLVADPAPVLDGFVRDVSAYPDETELLLAADVLITDYSSLMVDFASTGRPMLFFAYDLPAYEARLYVDLAADAPGPVLRTGDEVAAALRDLDGVRAASAERYARFRETFCALDDGGAAVRVVDRMLGASSASSASQRAPTTAPS